MKIRHIRALLLLMMATCVLPIQAQIRGSEIQVRSDGHFPNQCHSFGYLG